VFSRRLTGDHRLPVGLDPKQLRAFGHLRCVGAQRHHDLVASVAHHVQRQLKGCRLGEVRANPRRHGRCRCGTVTRSARPHIEAPPCAGPTAAPTSRNTRSPRTTTPIRQHPARYPSRRDLHNLQLCCTAPRRRTTSVVTGVELTQDAPQRVRKPLSSGRVGSVSSSHATRAPVTWPAHPEARQNPAHTLGTKSAMKIAVTTRKRVVLPMQTATARVGEAQSPTRRWRTVRRTLPPPPRGRTFRPSGRPSSATAEETVPCRMSAGSVRRAARRPDDIATQSGQPLGHV